MILNSDIYDKLKFFTQVLLPALGALYFALAGIWNLPSAEQVIGTVVALDTFLGVALHLSSGAYANSDARYDGHMEVEEKPDGVKTFSLNLNGDPKDLPDQKEVIFKVKKPVHKSK